MRALAQRQGSPICPLRDMVRGIPCGLWAVLARRTSRAAGRGDHIDE